MVCAVYSLFLLSHFENPKAFLAWETYTRERFTGLHMAWKSELADSELKSRNLVLTDDYEEETIFKELSRSVCGLLVECDPGQADTLA